MAYTVDGWNRVLLVGLASIALGLASTVALARAGLLDQLVDMLLH